MSIEINSLVVPREPICLAPNFYARQVGRVIKRHGDTAVVEFEVFKPDGGFVIVSRSLAVGKLLTDAEAKLAQY